MSTLRNRLLKAADFSQAAAIMEAYFGDVARDHKEECRNSGVLCDSKFWPACQQRAIRAAAVYEAYLEGARQGAASHLRREGLEEYADALVTGDYAHHLDLPSASGGIDGLLISRK